MRALQTKQQYITALRRVLHDYHVADIEDILQDYEDYFSQMAAKGYDDKESIRQLPSVQDLADSYKGSSEVGQSAAPSASSRRGLLVAVLVSDLMLLPIWGIGIVLLICFAIMGALLPLVGIMMLLPAELLGPITVPRPSLIQLLPAVFLMINAGVALLGIVLAIVERGYGVIRWSVLMRYRLMTGRRSTHLKFIPPVSKKVRHLLYKIILCASISASLMLIALILISFITTGTVNFLPSWHL